MTAFCPAFPDFFGDRSQELGSDHAKVEAVVWRAGLLLAWDTRRLVPWRLPKPAGAGIDWKRRRRALNVVQ